MFWCFVFLFIFGEKGGPLTATHKDYLRSAPVCDVRESRIKGIFLRASGVI